MSYLPSVVEHLWVSTVFLAGILLVVFLFRARLTASARFTLAAIGIVKFAIPAGALLAPMGRLFSHPSTAVIALPPQSLGLLRMDVAPISPGPWPTITFTIWAFVAAVVILRTSIARHRLVTLAVRTALPPTPREVAALARARSRARVKRSVDVARSTIAEAPALLRIVRPLVVLPASGCNDLSDSELEALLCHECAHVRRHDNLIARIESFICALFWFHPLIWIAQRITVIERERACDEAVAESADERETYLGALAKFCHASIVPRLSGVSCMATARLKERMDHMENYERLKSRAPSPRRIAVLGAAALVAYTVVAGLAGGNRALAGGTANKDYAVKINAVRNGDMIDLQGRVTENASGKVLAEPRVTFKAGEDARARAGNNDVDVVFNIRPGQRNNLAVAVTIDKGGMRVDEQTLLVEPGEATAAPPKYSGEPISMHLKDADLRDVIKTFGELTGFTMNIDEGISGKVSMSWTNVPWDQAFDELLRDNGLMYKIEGSPVQRNGVYGTIHVMRK